MTFVVTDNCQRCRFTDCVTVCPVDCFHADKDMLYIDPDECIDCGACEPECPVEAIFYEDDLPEELQPHLDDNAAFFTETLRGRDEALNSPGGAAKVGPVGADTQLVAGLPRTDE